MCLLYEAGIIAAQLVERRRRQREAEAGGRD